VLAAFSSTDRCVRRHRAVFQILNRLNDAIQVAVLGLTHLR
jgi:hypothetical protein